MGTRTLEMINWGIAQLIVTLLFIVIYFQLEKSGKEKKISIYKNFEINVKFADVFLGLTMVVLASIRCNAGSDFYNYYFQYNNVLSWFHSIGDIFRDRFQNGYIFLVYFVQKYIGGEYTIFTVFSLLVYLPLIKIIKKYADYPAYTIVLWIFLGYYIMSFNIMKQSMAMLIVLYAFFAFLEKEYWKFGIYSVLACFFHTTAIYFIICVFLVNKMKEYDMEDMFKKISIGSVLILIISNVLLRLCIYIVPERYIKYIDLVVNNESVGVKLLLGGFIVSIFYLYIIRYIIKHVSVWSDKNRSMLNMILLSVPFLILGMKYYLFNRIAYYSLQFIAFLFPVAIFEAKSNVTATAKKYLAVLFIVFNLSFNILCAENNYYHYGTIFTEDAMPVMEYVKRYQ